MEEEQDMEVDKAVEIKGAMEQELEILEDMDKEQAVKVVEAMVVKESTEVEEVIEVEEGMEVLEDLIEETLLVDNNPSQNSYPELVKGSYIFFQLRNKIHKVFTFKLSSLLDYFLAIDPSYLNFVKSNINSIFLLLANTSILKPSGSLIRSMGNSSDADLSGFLIGGLTCPHPASNRQKRRGKYFIVGSS